MKISKKPIGIALFVMLSAGANAQERTDTMNVNQMVGYTKVDVRTLGGAVEKVTAEQLKKGLVYSSLDALSGQAAGVQVQTGNQEAMVSAVRVRGTTSLTGGNDPLVIIDGVATDIEALLSVYPAEIESFTILKDASETSQYGSRGAAGVIEVATKKGRAGRFHISLDSNIGFESVYKNIEMLSGSEYRTAAQSMGVGYYDGGGDTNYRDVITRTGYVQNYHVAFGGGTDNSNYRASFGLMDHAMVVRTNRLRNYIAKIDVTQHAFDNRVTFDLGMFGGIRKANLLPNAWKLFYSAATFNPTIPEGRNNAGGFDGVPEAVWTNNPSALITMDNDDDEGHFNVHMKTAIDLGYGVQLTAFGSYSYHTDNANHYFPTYVSDKGEAYRADLRNEELMGRLSLEKTFNIKNSSLQLFGLFERQTTKTKGFNVTVTHFSTDAMGYHNLAAGAVRPWEGTQSFFQDSHMESLMLMAKYTLKNRYSLTVNARYDGSSKVGKNDRWGFFPSASGSMTLWDKKTDSDKVNISWLRFFDYLKVRAGYGLSGNLGGIDAYNSLQLMRPNGVVAVGGTEVTTLAVIRNANPDLRWEKKHTFNVGMNAAAWNNRLLLSLDYYYSKVTDMLYLYDVPVPPFTYDKMLANLGSMQNSGLEIGLGVTPLLRKDMELHIGMNMSFERNKLLSLDGDYHGQHLTAQENTTIASLAGAGFHGSSGVVAQIIGQPLGVFYLPHCKGLIEDIDGSMIYDVTDEKYICGQAMPKMRMSSNFSFRYKQWDIAAQLNGAFGHHIFNGTALTYMNMQSIPNYNVMKGAPEKNIQDQVISDYWLERGDYLHLAYVTLGWDVPVKWKYVRVFRLSLSVNNLFTITGYSGLTPLINSSAVNGTLGLDDKNCYPVYRSYSVGVSIKF